MYLADKEGEITPEVMKAKARTFDGFLAFFEDDALTVAGLTRERAQLWKASLKARKLAVKTVNDHISKLAALYAWSIDHGYATDNPFQGLRVRHKTVDERTEHYDPFTDDDLKRIFDPAAYHARFGSRPDYYWLPLVALFTGARREDIGGLRAQDVATVDGVNVLFVQHGKTKDARRKIPVHPTLQALGLLDYAAAVQSSGETSLFPSDRKKGGKGASAGDLFTDHLKALGMQDGRKVFHSFRATVISQLVTLEAHPEHSRVIVGHKGLDIHSGVYSRGIGLQAVADTLARLSYPCLDFDALKAPDPAFSGYLAKWKAGAKHRARLAQGRANNAAAKAARKETR
jgi:integrase